MQCLCLFWTTTVTYFSRQQLLPNGSINVLEIGHDKMVLEERLRRKALRSTNYTLHLRILSIGDLSVSTVSSPPAAPVAHEVPRLSRPSNFVENCCYWLVGWLVVWLENQGEPKAQRPTCQIYVFDHTNLLSTGPSSMNSEFSAMFSLVQWLSSSPK